MTFNIHSHDREFDPAVLEHSMKELANAAADQDIDVLALQECSQELEKEAVSGNLPMRCVIRKPEKRLRKGNAALLLAEDLQANGRDMYWTWAGIKLGYERFEEGLALFCRWPILSCDVPWISKIQDFSNWKSRRALIARTEISGTPVDFCSVHLGWWDDPEESFQEQMKRLDEITPKDRQVFLMGDFNSPAEIRGERFDMIRSLGWKDTWEAADQKDEGITVPGNIDGWRNGDCSGMRLDYIFSRTAVRVRSSSVLMNGVSGPVISDHYAVMAELDL